MLGVRSDTILQINTSEEEKEVTVVGGREVLPEKCERLHININYSKQHTSLVSSISVSQYLSQPNTSRFNLV